MENLGLNLQSFIINTLVFLTFFGLMHFLVLKKIGGVIAQREAKMQEADRRADETKQALTRSKEEFDIIVAQAKKQADQIMVDSKNQATDQTRKILESAQADAGEIIQKAQGVLAVEKEKMLIDFKASLEKAVKKSLSQILASQADKIDLDTSVLEEAGTKS